MVNSYPVLVTRSRLEPGESLASLFTRLTDLNFYDSLNILADLALAQSEHSNRYEDNLLCPSHIETYERLVGLTQLDLAELYNSTPHRFARVLTAPPNTVHAFQLPDGSSLPFLPQIYAHGQIRPLFAGQFCPYCLQESAYHHLLWMPVAISACLQHKCLLASRCQKCNAEVSVQAIVKARCDTCRSDLREYQALSLENDELGLLAQSIIQSWFLHNSTPEDTALLLPRQSPAVLYQVVDGLQSSAKTLKDLERPYLHYIDTEQHDSKTGDQKATSMLLPCESYCLYTTAFKSIMNWPVGFYEFIHAYQNGGPRRGLKSSSLNSAFGSLYRDWICQRWLYPEFQFVQEAFEQYTTSPYRLASSGKSLTSHQGAPEAVQRFACIDISEAAYLVGTSSKVIQLMLRNEQLSTYEGDDGKNLVLRAEIFKVQDQWNKSINLEEAARLLGATKQIIVSLVSIGLLAAEQTPAKGHFHWKFKRSAIWEFLEKVSSYVEIYNLQEAHEKGRYLNLAEASALLSSASMNLASLLLKLTQGGLRAFHPVSQRLRLESLLFKYLDIEAFIQTRKAENCWLGQAEASMLLGVREVILVRWVKAGLINPIEVREADQYFERASIDGFMKQHLTLEEAAKLIGEEKLRVQRWARANLFAGICISGPGIDGHHSYLFDKERLIIWRNERLTSTEALQLLGLSDAQLKLWQKLGRITPLKNMGGKQRWFLKEQILGLNGGRELSTIL